MGGVEAVVLGAASEKQMRSDWVSVVAAVGGFKIVSTVGCAGSCTSVSMYPDTNTQDPCTRSTYLKPT